ncbi:uncharacterized protein MELLADRAFT_61153 [Melampsora larici-populina 98AG31]|uniref:Uncharacterized protein n=1 Tax=Melampsora larici-populina (strain 98AG31 / pathotype 3-4-7) TaxID=747676 RepID=F4RDT4_MELLP|nr:uncharacterized protein MELLADRAFT_61153 [Melampsora larici-populina 98AG31]EGG09457.1 hypothetical protein MELLADRAFT_61153 [Melampsora larici-populina 98AG31]
MSVQAAQWARQRELQLKAINETTKDKRARLVVLIQLEEELLDARRQLEDMNPANAAIRTVEHWHDLLDLPRSLANLEAKVQEVAEELGNTELLNVKHRDNDRVKSATTVSVALGLLYEAKFGVIQQHADAATRTGATQQPRNEELRRKKRVLLKKKTDTYLRYAAKYNRQFRPTPRLKEPSFDEVDNMDVLDPFWDEAALKHLDEPWARCESTKAGIIAFQSKRSCEEELRRLGREARQLILWGIDHQARVEACKANEPGEARVLEWRSIHSGLSKRSCRLWKWWDHGLLDVMNSTAPFVEVDAAFDVNLLTRWKMMVDRTASTWGEILGVPIFWAHEDEEADEELVPEEPGDDDDLHYLYYY